MIGRREFLTAALAAPAVLGARDRIGRSRISAISDEVATTPAEAIEFAKKYGLEWLELRNVPGSTAPYFSMPEAALKLAAREFASNNIRISFLNTPLLKIAYPGTELAKVTYDTPAAHDRRIREQTQFDNRMSDLAQAIRAAHILGIDRIRVFTFRRIAEPEALFPRIAEVLGPMAALAQKEGVRLLIENEASCNAAKCSETAALLKLLPSKAMGTNWDALNGAAQGETPFPDGYNLLPKERIWNVQIKGKSLLETKEHLDWAAIIAALDRDGYQGELGLETHYFDGTNIARSHTCMRVILHLVEPS
jgi:sugar phosphate isomerase/epimerase